MTTRRWCWSDGDRRENAGGERAAIAYSIIATCDLVDMSPVHYLADVLPKLARGAFTHAGLAELTPGAWKKARAPAEVAASPQQRAVTSACSTS